jgi:hypothetical protein
LTFEPNNPNPKLMDFFKILKINLINKVREDFKLKLLVLKQQDVVQEWKITTN